MLNKINKTPLEIVLGNKCPICGRTLRRNLTQTGWFCCVQHGVPSVRVTPTLLSCDFQVYAPGGCS